ncbi:MAG: metal-sensitive transcriptional regulator [Candidatus Levyibacteriota bacterium]
MAYRPKNTEERIRHRLKIAKGHLNKVIDMINEDTYCIDVLHQIQAIESALKNTRNIIMENHLQRCVSDAISKGQSDKAFAEVMKVFKRQEL